jgi:hypothetical protein
MYNYRSEIYAQYKIFLFYKGEVDQTTIRLKSSAVECAKQICGFNVTIWGGTKEEEEKKKKKVECSIFLLDEGEW